MTTFFALLLKELKIFAVATFLKLIPGDKLQGSAVDTVAKTRGLGSIIEDMPKMTISSLATHLGTYHEMAQITFLDDLLILQRLGEAGPATTRIKLIKANEQWLTRDNINVDSLLLVVPVLVVEGWLGGVFLSHLVLHLG